MRARLAGKRALITGASQGIGRAVAIRFAQEGATVAINHRGSAAQAEETADHLNLIHAGPPTGPGHLVAEADVGCEAEVEAMFAQVAQCWGGLDILVNNAGIQSRQPSDELDLADYRRVVDTNLTGTVLCARAALRLMLAQGLGGSIINCSSVHQIIPKPGSLAYAVSKGGIGNVTRTLALEYADRGIRVNAVGPGAIITSMNDRWARDPATRAAVEAHIPMGRAGEPEEMAAVFAFLASDDASYITGQTLYACGGLTLFGEFRTRWAEDATPASQGGDLSRPSG